MEHPRVRALSPESQIHGLPRAVLALLMATAAGLLLPSPTQAWEFGDHAEVFASTVQIQSVHYSEDGAGGMLAVAVDQFASPDRVMVTRLDHTGDEVWGNNGFYLPIDFIDQWNAWPVAVTHDGGSGGGYFAYAAGITTSEVLRLTHVTASGSVDWTITVDDLGTSGLVPSLTLTPTLNGEVIMVWTRLVPTTQLYAARIDASGTVLWNGQVITSPWNVSTEWLAKPDGQGGAFVSYNTQPGDARVQRLAAANGARMWGNDGVLIWSLQGSVDDIVADGSGGAFVARSLGGVAYAQHLNASGAKTWISDVAVHDSQTSWFALSTMPQLCSDGAGGFVMVHGLEKIFAQRVDSNGALLWGGGVTVAMGTEVSKYARICSDGSGGALITYHDFWNINGSDICRQVNTARLDGFGTLVWKDVTDFCDFNWSPTHTPIMNSEPEEGVPISDGSGGVMVGWKSRDLDGNEVLEVRAHGYDSSGQAPTPRLTLLLPDSGEPGQTVPYSILGDYINLGMGYTLFKDGGGPQLNLTPTSQPAPALVQGTAILTGLAQGDYHLVVSTAGTPADTLRHAMGIGPPIPCAADDPAVSDGRFVDFSGSRRQSAFDSLGRVHTVWTEFDPAASEYLLRWQFEDGGWIVPAPLMADPMPIRDATIACDSQDRLHIAAIQEVSPTQQDLLYIRVDALGNIDAFDVYGDGLEHRNPVIAATADDIAHVVCESGSAGTQELSHFQCDGFIAPPQSVAFGFSPREPDLAAMNTDLELVFLRDSIIPGVQQVERASMNSGVWSAPQMLTFAVSVQSPSVAFDGVDRILYAWILDNEVINSIPPLVHTQLSVGGVLGEMRARPGLLQHHAVQVAAAGPAQFVMMTTESDGGPVQSIFVREGDGNVFYPRVQVNSGPDVAQARLSAQYGGAAVFGHWIDYGDPNVPVFGMRCQRAVVTATDDSAPLLVDTAKLEAVPNPFNPRTQLSFALERASDVTLTIYDARGRQVRTLFEGHLSAGSHSLDWQGTDDRGSKVASGVYYARLRREDGRVALTKVALVE